MNSVASGGVRAVCPECSSVKFLGRSELGQEVTCWDCGTSFVVRRHRRRSPAFHRLRTESLIQQWGDTPDIAPREVSRVVITVLSLLFLIAAGLLMLKYPTGIADVWTLIVNFVWATGCSDDSKVVAARRLGGSEGSGH